MALETENKSRDTVLTWRIESMPLCWHETGEELVSPTFVVDWLDDLSVNLSLYPRGIQGNGSHMSYFITQENENAPLANTDVNFKLYLLAADKTKVFSENPEGCFSTKKNGMFGWSRFISRSTLMGEKGPLYLPDETLTLCCRIWCECEMDSEEKTEHVQIKAFARTRLRKEEISHQMSIFPNDSNPQKIGEIRPILQESPLVKFFATFHNISVNKSLTIHMDAEKNEKIKWAVCNLVLVDERRKKLFWKKEYSWFNTIKCENVELCSRFPASSEQYVPNDMFTENVLYLACRFVFTTGSITEKLEMDDYGNSLDRFFEERLSDSTKVKQTSSCQTVSDALKSMYDSQLFHDLIVKGSNEEFKVHSMVLSSRSETFKKLISERVEKTIVNTNEDDDTLQRVIYFLYTDTIQDMHWEIAKRMYKAAIKYKIELLKEKCITFIKRHLSISNVCDVLVFTKKEKDSELKEYAKNFIIENAPVVYSSVEWSIFSKSNKALALEYMRARYNIK